MNKLVLTTPPSEEPVEVAELKDHLRITHTDDDAYIGDLGVVARQYVERIQGRAYMTQTWTLWLDSFPRERYIELWRVPLQDVTHVKYYDAADSATEFASTNYMVDDVSTPGRVILKDGVDWPSATLRVAKAVEVQFDAGYTSGGAMIAELGSAVLAIKQMVNHWYVNRIPVGMALSQIPETAEALIDQGCYVLFA
jgi:uncharacterized phiE125 gp8 family phage protein